MIPKSHQLRAIFHEPGITYNIDEVLELTGIESENALSVWCVRLKNEMVLKIKWGTITRVK